jgi:hypothetical protein
MILDPVLHQGWLQVRQSMLDRWTSEPMLWLERSIPPTRVASAIQRGKTKKTRRGRKNDHRITIIIQTSYLSKVFRGTVEGSIRYYLSVEKAGERNSLDHHPHFLTDSWFHQSCPAHITTFSACHPTPQVLKFEKPTLRRLSSIILIRILTISKKHRPNLSKLGEPTKC